VQIGTRVITPHSEGEIISKDMCHERYNKDTQKFTGNLRWTGRWIVVHDVFPKCKSPSFFPDGRLAYWTKELRFESEYIRDH
jgi:hypothetical protein